MTVKKVARKAVTRRKRGVSFRDACTLASALEGVEESTSYGTPSLKVRGKFMARLKEDGETLVLRMDFVNRDLVLKAEPRVFYLTDHYRDYPAVLVRLPETTREQLKELLEDAWRLVKPPGRRARGTTNVAAEKR